MKKVLRAISLIVVTVIVCCSLSGCMAIDKLRQSQAFWIDDSTIEYQNQKYIALPYDDKLQPVTNEHNTVEVTQKDVPVLLSAFIGDTFDLSDDGVFLCIREDAGYISYCLEEHYKEINDKIQNGYDIETYCYEYYDYENDEYKYYKFSKQEEEAVEYVVNNIEPQIMPEAATLDFEHLVVVEACSEDMYFRKDAAQITIKDDTYYVVITQYEDTLNEQTLLYKVPEDKKDIFVKMLKPSVESEVRLYEDFE